MALLLKMIYNELHYYIVDCKDTRIEHYFLLGSPLKIISIVGLYLYFVYEWGPKFMKDREPYELKNVLLVYNLLQILVNLIMGILGIQQIYNHIGQFSCIPTNYNTDAVGMYHARGTYSYYLLKISDLLDTVFFVLRKKYNQITFLHVYHHVGMCFGAYTFTQYMPGGQFAYIGIVNCWVHTVMYFYYFLTAFKPELKASIWWKKHITQIQLIQFASIIFVLARPLIEHTSETCYIPRFMLQMGIIQNSFMFAMFADFYYKAYIKKSKRKVEQDNGK